MATRTDLSAGLSLSGLSLCGAGVTKQTNSISHQPTTDDKLVDVTDGFMGEEEDLGDEDFETLEGCENGGRFEEALGCLEDLVVSDEFQQLMQSFCKKHCHVFEDTEENKLEYTAIFEKYANTMEKFIEKRLSEQVEGFSMEEFVCELSQRGEDECPSEMTELLASFCDFNVFKEQILSYKGEQGFQGLELSGFSVSSKK
eukprot:GDKI01031046.1.p1 GENE.GDKI01031046.1~~GDKI01031046.1.p1  ORF type:complete len:219 (-),score=70.71 GDKI01031046.1:91-690(-)